MFFHPFYAVERTLSLAGTVTVIDELLFQSGTSLWAMRWCTTRSRKSAAKISRFTGLLIMKAMEREGRYVPALISRYSSTHLVRNRSRRQGHCRYCVSFTALEIRLEDILQRNASEFLICKRLCCNSISLYHFVYRKVFIEKPRPDARNYFCCSYCCCSRCRCSHSHKERCSPDCCRTPRRTSKCCLFLSLRASLHEESLPTTLFNNKQFASGSLDRPNPD